MKKILNIFVIGVMLIILFMSSVILITSLIRPDEVPSFFSYKPFIVLSGSMEAQILAGDLAVVKEVDTSTLKKGDIIAFRNDNIVITHRIEEIITEDGKIKYITKGDNNNTVDTMHVEQSQVEGKYCFRIGRLGNLAMFIQTPIGMLVCLSIPLILLILMQITEAKIERKIIEENEKEKQGKQD